MSKLLDYLNILDKDAAAREAHLQDPIATMKAFGLSSGEQAAVISGNKKSAAVLVGISAADLPSYIFAPNTSNNDSDELEFGSELGSIIMYPSFFEHANQSRSLSARA